MMKVSSWIATFLLLGLGGCATMSTREQARPRSTQALASAQRACQGIPLDQRREPLFGTQLKIAARQPLHTTVGRQRSLVPEGAAMSVVAKEGLTQPWLHRLVTCHAAQYASGEMPEAFERDPLALPDVEVHIAQSGGRFIVRLTSDEAAVAREIAKRVMRL